MRRRPRRGTKPIPFPRGRKRRRLGTFFFVVGILTVLGVTFAVGALASRFSLRPASVASAKTVDRTAKPAPQQQPELTFYRELTAPMTPSLPPKAAAKPPAKREPPPPAPSEKRELPPAAATEAPASSRVEAGRYTVQVAAYTARDQAEALRAKLAAAGHAAYIFEGDAPGGARYRVRIGSFATAEDARQAAARLATEARVATYVTTR